MRHIKTLALAGLLSCLVACGKGSPPDLSSDQCSKYLKSEILQGHLVDQPYAVFEGRVYHVPDSCRARAGGVL